MKRKRGKKLNSFNSPFYLSFAFICLFLLYNFPQILRELYRQQFQAFWQWWNCLLGLTSHWLFQKWSIKLQAGNCSSSFWQWWKWHFTADLDRSFLKWSIQLLVVSSSASLLIDQREKKKNSKYAEFIRNIVQVRINEVKMKKVLWRSWLHHWSDYHFFSPSQTWHACHYLPYSPLTWITKNCFCSDLIVLGWPTAMQKSRNKILFHNKKTVDDASLGCGLPRLKKATSILNGFSQLTDLCCPIPLVS